jgi:sec-independent protein translocase protein TatB
VSFLGVGWQEMALIMVLMLVVVGPERMPQVAYQIGKAVRTLQSYARVVRSEFREEIAFVEEQYKTVKGEMNTARDTLREETRKIETEFRDATASVEELPQTMSNVVSFSDRTTVPEAATSAAEPAATTPAATPEPPRESSAPPLVF